MIIRENEAAVSLSDRHGTLENFHPLVVRRFGAETVGGEIESIDVGEPPGLIFPGWLRELGKFVPGLFAFAAASIDFGMTVLYSIC